MKNNLDTTKSSQKKISMDRLKEVVGYININIKKNIKLRH